MGQNCHPAAGALGRLPARPARTGWGARFIPDESLGKPMEYIWQTDLTFTLSLRWADSLSLRSRKS